MNIELLKELFRAWWRPGTGWVCVFALLYHYVIQPALIFLIIVISKYADISFTAQDVPMIDIAPIVALVGTLLTMSGMRSFEKVKAVEGK